MATISEALATAIHHHQVGRLQAAEEIYRQILAVEPNQADALHLLGVIAHQVGKHDIAVEYIGRAIGLNGTEAAFHNNLGEAYRALRKTPEAVACYRRALELKPDYAEARYNLGNAFQFQRELDKAIACYRRALELKPDYAEAHSNLGVALTEQGKPDEAVACYRRALELNPNYADAHNNLGAVLLDQGKLDEAVACYRKALELKPDYVEAYNNLGVALTDQGELDEAVACFRRVLELNPEHAEGHSNLLSTLQYRVGVTLSELAEAHAEYDRLHAGPLRTVRRLHKNVRDPHRRLRVGFVSPDFGRHPVGYFLVRGLENLGRSQWETVCYCDRIIKDDLTTRLQAAATLWRDVTGLSDEELAEEIRADRIDILFDLAGHTARNRLLVFARKPAPIQVTWAGYVGTTGLEAMDYILADRYEIPVEAEPHYGERVLRMPEGYVCYDPPSYAPPVSPLPALKQGDVTFGSFNNPAKINWQVIEVWAEILRRLPQSRLVLKYKGMSFLSPAKRLAERFAGWGIDPGRLEFLESSPHAELLEHYHRIDVALDPFPYSGGLTTCEALWMGVPVITCPGETFASRHSLSHLSNVGLTETIARTLDEYVELAVSLASDLPRLAALRAGLRERMAAAPLCDGKRFAANLTTVLRDIWRRWIVQG